MGRLKFMGKLKVAVANDFFDVCSSRRKIGRGRYEILVRMPDFDQVYYAERGVNGWWLSNDKDSPITKVDSLLSAEFKAQEIEMAKYRENAR